MKAAVTLSNKGNWLNSKSVLIDCENNKIVFFHENMKPIEVAITDNVGKINVEIIKS